MTAKLQESETIIKQGVQSLDTSNEQMIDDQERHMEQMLDKKDQDIAQLTASLNKLARMKTRELERLPTLFKQLQSSMTEQTNVFNGWVAYRKEHVTTQALLISELLALGNVQIQLVAQLKTYQSTITPPDYLENATTQLESDTVKWESELSELVNAQSKIEQSQAKIKGSQTEIQTELKELSTLRDKSEK